MSLDKEKIIELMHLYQSFGTIHIIPTGKKFRVWHSLSKKAYRIEDYLEEAVDTARYLSKLKTGTIIILHKKDGSIDRKIKRHPRR